MQEAIEIEECKQIGKIIKKMNKSNKSLLLQFLGFEIIESIYKINKQINSPQFILRLCGILYLMKKYINCIDRSYYFLFYEQEQFIKIEKQHFQTVAIENIQYFSQFTPIFQNLLEQIKIQLSQCSQFESIVQNIERLIFDSDIPMPKIKKETVAMYCQSAFQLFLAEIKFPSMGVQVEQQWQQNLKQFFQNHQKQYLKIFIKSKHSSEFHQSIRSKILAIRYYAKSITTHNFNYYKIQNCHPHNIIILIVALLDNLIQTYYQMVSKHKDPFMKFIQFNLRYSIFKNIIISIQQNFSFMFNMYHILFEAQFKDFKIQPQYCLWFIAISKWTERMGSFQKQMQGVYLYIATNQRNNNLLNFIEKECQQLPAVFSPIRNEVNQRDFLIKLKEQLYENGQQSTEAFFQNNPDNYLILAKDYLEYLVDSSVNQFSVHWCGSSTQIFPVSSPYYKFNDSFLSYNSDFIKYISKIVLEKSPPQISYTILKKLLQDDLEFIDYNFVKPFTSKNLLEQIYSQLTKILNFKQMGIFETNEEKYPKLDFNYKDNLLKYFNQKAQISQTCLDKLQPLYNTFQSVQFDEILKIATTKLDDNSSSSNTDEEYVSDDEKQGILIDQQDKKQDLKTMTSDQPKQI